MTVRQFVPIEEFLKDEEIVNYKWCEAVIYPNGYIMHALPGHTQALERIFEAQTGISRKELYDKHITIYENPMIWLIERTGCILIWGDKYLMPETLSKPTREQLKTIQTLSVEGFAKTKMKFWWET